MIEQEIVEKIGSYVLNQIGIEDTSEIEDIDDNPGGFWINLKNGETYFLMVGKCENDEQAISKTDNGDPGQ